jgi:hypothetical protein
MRNDEYPILDEGIHRAINSCDFLYIFKMLHSLIRIAVFSFWKDCLLRLYWRVAIFWVNERTNMPVKYNEFCQCSYFIVKYILLTIHSMLAL